VYVKEITVRYRMRRVGGKPILSVRLSSPRDAATVLVPILRQEIVEVCGVLCLSKKCDVLAYHEVSRGTIDHTVVHPRDVFRIALLAHAAAVIVGHNHPSGDPSPSPDDFRLTDRLNQAGAIIGVDLNDHLIVGNDQYFSFREAGQLF